MSAYKRIREFIEGEDAKADDIEAEFDNISSVLKGNVGPDNIAEHAVEKKHLAEGFNRKQTSGSKTVTIAGGAVYSEQYAVGSLLGETPSHVGFTFITAANYGITFEGRIIAWDAVGFTFQVVASATIPGGGVEIPVYWLATGGG